MQVFVTDIEQDALKNEFYRRVLLTERHTQLVLMTLLPGEETGIEVHKHHDQLIRVEAGSGALNLADRSYRLSDGVVVVIPAGIDHNIANTSPDEPLRLYTLYSPPAHPHGIVHHRKKNEKAKH